MVEDILKIKRKFLNPNDYLEKEFIGELLSIEWETLKSKTGTYEKAIVEVLVEGAKSKLSCFQSSFNDLIEAWTGEWKTWIDNHQTVLITAVKSGLYANWVFKVPPVEEEVVK